jgi:hypothetical protein
MTRRLLHIGITLNVIFAMFYAYALFSPDWNINIKSANLDHQLDDINHLFNPTPPVDSTAIIAKLDSIRAANIRDSLQSLRFIIPKDSGKKILLIGDSQLENLRYWVNKSLVDNHYELSASIIWYGSSTKQWALTDTLEYFHEQFKPDFILIALGLNELFVYDLKKREEYCNTIKEKLANLKIPYYFIGPAGWVKDRGITEVMSKVFGESFYPSHLLQMERANDGRHPSSSGAKSWFKEVSIQMTKLKILDLQIEKDSIYKNESKTITLKVPES